MAIEKGTLIKQMIMMNTGLNLKSAIIITDQHNQRSFSPSQLGGFV
jgi:hypothetical protein